MRSLSYRWLCKEKVWHLPMQGTPLYLRESIRNDPFRRGTARRKPQALLKA